MTEDEMKAKICHRSMATENHTHCIGSACTAWLPSTPMENQRVHPDVLRNAWHGWTITDPRPDAKGRVVISPPADMISAGKCIDLKRSHHDI